MDKNSFVSIHFTQNRLLLVKLGKRKRKVELFATIDLPPGLINDHEVKDEKALANILKRVWKKLKIRERFVGIVIPEFSTYTKAINLPRLEAGEIDEAVKWQAEEYIPLDPEHTTLDWKIIDEKPEEVRILAVAVNEKLLNGYVMASDSAGLFPLVVETPSLSLVRLAGEDDSPKMIIYYSFDEIIVTLSKGPEILTSSVLGATTSSQVLITTIARILRHFEEIKVSKIFVGGMPGNNSYISDIFNSFKIPMEKLQIKISGISDSDLQKYLIPISMQYMNASGPSDTKTVNLLPPEIIMKYKGKKLGVQLWGLMLITTLLLVGCLMALLGTYFYMAQGMSRYKNFDSFSDVSYQKSKSASDEIKNVNSLSEKVIKIDAISMYPQEVLSLLYQKKPENIALISYEIDLEGGLVSISGIAVGRNDLYDFKKNIEESGEFQKVVLPLTSFEQGENIEFDMSFVYSKLTTENKEKK